MTCQNPFLASKCVEYRTPFGESRASYSFRFSALLNGFRSLHNRSWPFGFIVTTSLLIESVGVSTCLMSLVHAVLFCSVLFSHSFLPLSKGYFQWRYVGSVIMWSSPRQLPSSPSKHHGIVHYQLAVRVFQIVPTLIPCHCTGQILPCSLLLSREQDMQAQILHQLDTGTTYRGCDHNSGFMLSAQLHTVCLQCNCITRN